MLSGKHILLIIGGGIAAFKSLQLIRLLRAQGADVTPVLTAAAAQFVTPLSVGALANSKVFSDLFDLNDEAEMGHIELSRAADIIVVAPATADLMAKMAGGLANDLASTVLMATDKPVLIAPAMNVRMWEHAATRRNLAILRSDGVHGVGPVEGEMACGEFGFGRMAEPKEIAEAVAGVLANGPLKGRRILVTSGPTHEPIDPVRYIANRSSGRQGAAIARALSAMGGDVVFITGPAVTPPPAGVQVVRVNTADQMARAVKDALPADAAVFAAAVADWKIANPATSKTKKTKVGTAPELKFVENTDILAATAQAKINRPKLVIGFAAETDDVVANATAKRARKGCDWIVANDVREETGNMGGTDNAVTLITAGGVDPWPRMTKDQVARRLAEKLAAALGGA